MVQVPIRVDYAATELAKTLVQKVQPIWLWGVANLPVLEENRRRFDTEAQQLRLQTSQASQTLLTPVEPAQPTSDRKICDD